MGGMVILGVAPGIRTLSYCVLARTNGVWEIVDFDTLRGAGVAATVLAVIGARDLLRSFRVHSLILSVILERHLPTVIVVGAPADSGEDRRFVDAATEALKEMGDEAGIDLLEVSDMESMCAALGCQTIRGLRKAIRSSVGIELHTRDMKIVLATAAAATAVVALNQTTDDDTVSILDRPSGGDEQALPEAPTDLITPELERQAPMRHRADDRR